MGTFTPNYQLHQWDPQDNFLRTDFNTDLSKIDTALAGKADNSAITNLQGQLSSSIGNLQGQINNLPNPGSITELQNQINAQQQQINSKPGFDSITNLQNQINTQQGQINTQQGQINSLSSGKAEFVRGSYTGNGTSNIPYNQISQTINLGFQPKAVFVSGGNFYGIAIGNNQTTLLRIVSTGMEVTYDYAYGDTPNTSGISYTYLALR